MNKLLMALGALALAATFGFSLGRYAPQEASGTAWAQKYISSPVAAGKVVLGRIELKGIISVDGLEEACSIEERIDPVTGKVELIRGPTRFTNLTLSVLNDPETENTLGQWFQTSIVEGKLERKDGSIIIYDRETGDDLLRYNFYEGWPCKWYVPDLDSDQSGLAIEKIEIAVEKVEKAL